MEFKKGDRVRINPTTYKQADKRAATGRGFLPRRGSDLGRAADFSAAGTVIGFGNHRCPHVRWDDPKWGVWYYDTEYLMPLSTAGF